VFLAGQIDRRTLRCRSDGGPRKESPGQFSVDDCYKAHAGELPFSRTAGTLYHPDPAGLWTFEP
jgi:hypothetical protein